MKRARVDEKTVVVYYGSPGAFSEDAALRYFGPGGIQSQTDLDTLPSRSLDELFAAVTDGHCEYAVVPLENNSSGLLQDVLLKLVSLPTLHIVGEVLVAEEHCLCAMPGTKREDVRTVISHSHLLIQSESWLLNLEKANGCHPIGRQCSFDSAGACALVDSESKAAIASRRAGESAGLSVVGSKLADLESETRYIVLARQPATASNRLGLRCSVTFTLRNQEGALFKCLSCFAFRSLNVLKMHSLPLASNKELRAGFEPGRWDYAFVVDFQASTDPKVNAAALDNLREFATRVRILGEYSSHESATKSISRNASHGAMLSNLY